MHRLSLLGTCLLLAGCDAAFTTRVDVVARAADAELSVAKLAELVAHNSELPLRRDVVEGVALLWVDYTLLADRLFRGDSLLDSATVMAATWPDVQQLIASAYHARLIGTSHHLDSAQVDSAYRAGDLRLIQHVLFRADATTAADVKAAKRRQAEYVLGQLRRGEATWHEAAGVTDEPDAKDRDGSLGVIARGEMVEPFEVAAYSLQPGQVSSVTETSFGFHIVYRPPLGEVREEFKAGVEERLEQAFDTLYLRDLEERWDLKLRSGAVATVREIALDPLRAKRSSKVIATYRGGEFRIRDLARWLQGMDPRVRQGVAVGSDEQVTRMIRALARNEVLLREAVEAGVALTPDDLAQLTDQLRRRLSLVRGAVGVGRDSIAALRALPEPQAREILHARVIAYLEAVSRTNRVLRLVPPFLADHLRADGDWELVPAGVERTLERARDIRTQLDSVRAAQPRPQPAPTSTPQAELVAPPGAAPAPPPGQQPRGQN